MHVRRRLTPEMHVALAVRILDNEHLGDVYDRAIARMGNRGKTLGPLDLSRNPLRSATERLNRAHEVPAAVDGLDPALAMLCDDRSARVTIARYAAIGARPMPTPLSLALRRAGWYRIGIGYGGTQLGYSARSGKLYAEPVRPDSLELVYASDDPFEPTVIKHRRPRMVRGEWVDTIDTYDLTDLGAPVFTSRTASSTTQGGQDITELALGADVDMVGGWPSAWRYDDGRPYHRIVISGHPSRIYDNLGPVEATLNIAVGWTAWGAGIIDAGHPQRNVRNLVIDGQNADLETGTTGVDTGPETVLVWRDIDPDKPGEHWQDNPGFDPEVVGRALRSYDVAASNALGLPIDYERTGGEPTATEQAAIETAVRGTYDECRRHDGEVLRRLAAMANRMRLPGVPSFAEDPYHVLYRNEIHEALEEVAAKAAAEAEQAAAATAVMADDNPEE